ncbi:MAG: hypothetical protein IKN38_03155 [Clostridia bacterium]|nr:hypothetical protein [Clostridia bacterium]
MRSIKWRGVLPDIEAIRPTCVLVVEAKDRKFYAHIEDGAGGKAFAEKLNSEVLSVVMTECDGQGTSGAMPWELPGDAVKTTPEPGDIVLRPDGKIAVCYAEGSAEAAKLASIGNKRGEELQDAFGGGDVRATFYLEWGE